MSKTQNRLNDIIAKLRQSDFRVTPQRIAIIRVLLDSHDHPTIEQVYAKVKTTFPTTSLATVYKTVNLLKEMGEILEVANSQGRNRYDGKNPTPHPHLICTDCKSVTDQDVSLLDRMADELQKITGYISLSHQIEFFGICPNCQEIRLQA